jgi:hypothetical protein
LLAGGFIGLPNLGAAQVTEFAPDFDGDGFADLAIGISGKKVNGKASSGAVEVLYGSSDGLSPVRSQLWHQDNLGLGTEAEPGDAFGQAQAWGDFNGDGFTDLAIGTPFEDIKDALGSPLSDAGAVYVLYGSASGLAVSGAQRWTQDSEGVPDAAETDDSFGFALSSGDYDGDGFADLAVDAILESVPAPGGDIPQAGAVNVLYGSAAGLTAARAQLWSQESPGIQDSPEDFSETFGRALASADFDGDGLTDLAVGVPQEKTLGRLFCPGGQVHVIYGAATGLSSARNQIWNENRPGVPGECESAEGFGSAVMGGDFNGDGFADLAIGVPAETLEQQPGRGESQGRAIVLYGSAGGISSVDAQSWSQLGDDVLGYAAADDNFGSAFAVGDFDGDGFFDLAVGAPFDNVRIDGNDVPDAGAVNVIFGAVGGLTAAGNFRRHQGNTGVDGDLESGDAFGGSLVAGDFDADGFDDLAVGVIGEDLPSGSDSIPFAGAVNVFFGTPFDSFSMTMGEFLNEDSPGVSGDPEVNDLFGQLR